MNGPSPHRTSLRSLSCLPLVLAAACFSYALATSAVSPQAAARGLPKAQGRFLGQPLRFTNPFLQAGSDFQFLAGGDVDDDPQGFDLGDACSNAVITRYVTAAGGYLPYTFALRRLLGSQGSGGDPLASLSGLSPAGILSTNLPADLGRYLRFNVLLTDVIGSQRLGTFRLSIVPGGQDLFRFAQDRLPTAQLGNTYFTRIETIGRSGVFALAPGSMVWVKGAATATSAQLEDVGLTLAPDGVLFGRPTKTGDITFTARATDPATLALAQSRAGLGPDQTFTITVEQKVPLTSELLAANCSLRGSRTALGADSFSYSGWLDSRGYSASKLAGSPCTLRVGQAVFTGAFDDRGKVYVALGAASGTKKAKSALSAALSPGSGRLKIKLTGVDLASNLALPRTPEGQIDATAIDKKFRTVVLGLDIGAFRTCEVLKMETVALSGGAFKMTYQLGKRGFSRAGGCQIISVKGLDANPAADPAGDRWLVRFFGVPGQDVETSTVPFAPPAAPQTVLGATKATLEIGDYSQDVSLQKNSVRLEFKATSKDAGFYRVLLDPRKFVHRLETNVLSEDDTSIPAAINTKAPTVFPLGVSFTGFNGETGRVIMPDRHAWKQR